MTTGENKNISMNIWYEEVKGWFYQEEICLKVLISGLINMIGKGQSDDMYNLEVSR